MSSGWLPVLGATAAALLILSGTVQLFSAAGDRRRAVRSATPERADEGTAWARADRAFQRTALGRWLRTELTRAGVKRSPLAVLVGVMVVGLGAAIAIAALLAPALAYLAVGVMLMFLRWYLRQAQVRRREAFISQLPELARVLSNATHAGLSLPTALAVAAEEVDDPAREEMLRISRNLAFGQSIEQAVDSLNERMPSREVRILVSTLVISSRSGGALVSALRDIADTLEARKEVRREVRTTLAQALSTGRLIVLMGVAILVGINMMKPNTVDRILSNPLGVIALVSSAVLSIVGLVVVQKMTAIEP